jgi:hypothetical protein
MFKGFNGRLNNRQVAMFLGKDTSTMSHMKKNNPKTYALLRLGYACILSGLNEEDVLKLRRGRDEIK